MERWREPAMSAIERKSWLSYGWRGSRRLMLFCNGLRSGGTAIAFLVGGLILTHAVTIRYRGADSSLLMLGSAWALGFALVGFTEEMLFRGYLYMRLSEKRGPRAAAIAMSIGFGLAHLSNHGESLLGIVQVIMFGLILCLSVWRTGSLIWAVAFHAAWDWGESFLFGASDSGNVIKGALLTTIAHGPTWLSGGSDGPEGSLLVLPLRSPRRSG